MPDLALRLSRPLRATGLSVALLLSLTLAACSQENRLTLHTAKGDFPFIVEFADTPQQQSQGLMYRQELAKDAGMLFDFHAERPVSFWMRNTFIPLDMVFVGADGVVKSVHVNARPQDPTSIPSGVPVQFVLEIAGGRSVEIGLVAGDTMISERVGKGSE